MKLPFKHIAILVLVSLIGIFAYQAYWLTGLYHTMKDDLEHSIVESMRMSDYNEMMLRVENLRYRLLPDIMMRENLLFVVVPLLIRMQASWIVQNSRNLLPKAIATLPI